MLIRPLTQGGVAHVIRNMRDCDRREVFACRFDDDEDWLIEEIMACQVRAALAGVACAQDGEAVALYGAYARTPCTVECALIATDRWEEIARPFTRWILREALPALAREGIARAECRALQSHRTARAWLRRLGAKQETLVRGFGRSGETFVQYAHTLTHGGAHVLQSA